MEEPIRDNKIMEIAKQVLRVPNKNKEQTNDQGSNKERETEIEQTGKDLNRVREAYFNFIQTQKKKMVIGGVVVAYEPVWAIGTGQSASPEIAQSMMAHIRQTLAALSGADTADAVPLLYGGSVNAGNIAGYIAQPDVSGALVGGASLDAESFADIVSIAGTAQIGTG